MNTQVIAAGEEAIERASTLLAAGELVSFPTDTVYGLAADISNGAAIERIFQVKERNENKAIAVLVASEMQIPLLTGELPPAALRLARAFWPGGLTLIVRKLPALPAALSPTDTVGIRMPDHSFALRLLERTGPLATTSANLSGGPNPKTAQDVFSQLGGRIPLIIDGGPCPGGVPSTVVECSAEQIQVLRAGAIPTERLLEVLR
jgi:L-threonylcarbamoyladenylate synthase